MNRPLDHRSANDWGPMYTFRRRFAGHLKIPDSSLYKTSIKNRFREIQDNLFVYIMPWDKRLNSNSVKTLRVFSGPGAVRQFGQLPALP
jgi:hypothetical protein